MTRDALFAILQAWAYGVLPAEAAGRVWPGHRVTTHATAPKLAITVTRSAAITTTTSTTAPDPGNAAQVLRTDWGTERLQIQIRATGAEALPWIESLRRRWMSHDQELIDGAIGAGGAGDLARVPYLGGAGPLPEHVCTFTAHVDWSDTHARARVTAVAATIATSPDVGPIVVNRSIGV